MHASRAATAAIGAAIGAAMVAALWLGGCAADTAHHGGGQRCPAPTPAATATSLPAALDLESFGTVTDAVRKQGFVNATAVATGSLKELHERFSRSLEDSGYSIVGSENEVVEADVFFARGQHTTGGAKFIQTGCEGRVRIQVFVGRSAPGNG